jgi:hypothetical protein
MTRASADLIALTRLDLGGRRNGMTGLILRLRVPTIPWINVLMIPFVLKKILHAAQAIKTAPKNHQTGNGATQNAPIGSLPRKPNEPPQSTTQTAPKSMRRVGS